MIGTKERHFAPFIEVSLEDLAPPEHFYRHLERTLDLSFVRELVEDTYASGGRPSIDPVVFFKLQLVMFFEDIVRCDNRIAQYLFRAIEVVPTLLSPAAVGLHYPDGAISGRP